MKKENPLVKYYPLVKKYFPFLVLLVIYFFTLGVRIYWLSQKDGLHVDEGLTLAYSFCSNYIVSENYEFNREFTGEEIKRMSLVSGTGLKGAFSDIKKLWIDNRDPPHTNIYYTFLRLSLAGLKTSDFKQIVSAGGTLNLLFFTVSFVFFFLLMRLLFPSSVFVQYAAIFCAFFNTAAISNTIFLRPYQLQEMIFIIFCYLFVKYFNVKKEIIYKEKPYINKLFILFSFVTAVTLLTGYYAPIFIGIFGIYIIYTSCREKNYSNIVFYVLVLCLGVLLAKLLYLNYFNAFTSYRATEIKRTLSANAVFNIKFSLTAIWTLLHKHFFTYPVLAISGLSLAYLFITKQKLIFQKPALFIFIMSIVYFIVVEIIAPYKILRYVMPVFPFLVILPFAIIQSVKWQRKSIYIMVMLMVCFSISFNAANRDNIENAFPGKQDEYKFAKDKDIPVYVNVQYYPQWNYANIWKYGNLIPYFNDEQKYIFTGDFEDAMSAAGDDFYLVVEYNPVLKRFNEKYEALAQEVTLMKGGEPETWEPYFACIRVKR
jgi:hypothetical protein